MFPVAKTPGLSVDVKLRARALVTRALDCLVVKLKALRLQVKTNQDLSEALSLSVGMGPLVARAHPFVKTLRSQIKDGGCAG